MSRTLHRRTAGWLTAGAVAVAAVAGIAATPASAATPTKAGHSVQKYIAAKAKVKVVKSHAAKSTAALTPAVAARLKPSIAGSVGDFGSVAVVRGTNGRAYATTGSGFADLGGQIVGGPAVASDLDTTSGTANDSIYFLARGVNGPGSLFLRTESSGWVDVYGSPTGCQSITAAYDNFSSFYGFPAVVFSCLQPNFRTYIGVIEVTPGLQPNVHTELGVSQGPLAFGASVNGDEVLTFTSHGTVPGQAGQLGTTYQYTGFRDVSTPIDPTTYRKAFLACSQTTRLSSAISPTYSTDRGAIACRANNGNIVFIGKNVGRNLGGAILGSPGLALNPSAVTDPFHFPQRFVNETDVVSNLFAEGTNHKLYAKTIYDSDNSLGFTADASFTLLGGAITPGTGVQATAFSLI